ncbi:MAG: 5-(carboxyamino)imidazole ribonucleotide mutase [Bdellovibrionaceae bacterium]|nr:5-(carboxyamino)imidazole ribonucleotide mutase [Pseudobdellovibrionaceae bacterium]|tara:strand:- start:1635 stop:2123 length:489 start_codon:yes stop_codon:yes gene_type:complete
MSHQVSIIMGSDSDWPVMEEAALILKDLGVSYQTEIVSAHRTPEKMVEFAKNLENQGVKVVIAGAGGAAHLPGMVAALTTLPVIGVPVEVGPLSGKDALYSIVQMPKGVPVACVAIGNSTNAGLLAAQMIAHLCEDKKILSSVKEFRKRQTQTVLKKKLPIE